mmetsp:Transcript_11539/g.29219  ORF Transcript_11539/g.29219 Transcript_11539/m.29219 type:complete len:208 (-) Transcript_11539:427-1050(-)
MCFTSLRTFPSGARSMSSMASNLVRSAWLSRLVRIGWPPCGRTSSNACKSTLVRRSASTCSQSRAIVVQACKSMWRAGLPVHRSLKTLLARRRMLRRRLASSQSNSKMTKDSLHFWRRATRLSLQHSCATRTVRRIRRRLSWKPWSKGLPLGRRRTFAASTTTFRSALPCCTFSQKRTSWARWWRLRRSNNRIAAPQLRKAKRLARC